MTQKKVEASPFEQFEEAITVVGIKGWIFLASSLLLFVPIIVWSFLGTVPIAVMGECLFFDPSDSSRTENLEIYGFLPFVASQSIYPGMEVKCSVDSLGIRKAGLLIGVVKEVLPYPVDLTEKHMEQIPSTSLKTYLLSSSSEPLALVIAKPLVHKNDSSKFVWTYGRDPMIHLQSGMTGMITITLNRDRPISYVFPSLSSSQGTK